MCVLSVLLFSYRSAAQTYVSAPLSQPNTTGEVYHNNSITLSPGFSANGSNGSFHAFISTTLPIPASFSGDQNYLSQWIPQVAVKTADDLKALENYNEKVSINVQYFDGLGRATETIQKSSTPNGADLIQPYEYDEQSRPLKSYLSYAAGDGLAGAFRSNPISAQNVFYNSGSNLIAQSATPFSKVLVEASPLQRTLEQGSPGDSWQLTGDPAPNSGHTSKFDYVENDETDIDDHDNTRMAINYGVDIDINGNRSLTANGHYSANDLFVKVIKGPNWITADGRTGTEEIFTDKSGKVILKRAFNKNGSALKMISTYFVYDDFGKLCYILPPGVDPDHPVSGSIPIQVSILDKFCHQYQYDQKQRLIAEKNVGKDWSYNIYNAMGQIVATQDGNQRLRNEWNINKYDGLGRSIISAIWNNNNVAISRTDLQSILDQQLLVNSLYETRGTAANGYTNLAWPQNINQYYSISYYDDYDIDGFPSGYNYQVYAGNPTGFSKQTIGYVTATKTWPLSNSSLALWSVNYYDDKANTIQLNSTNHLLGNDLYNSEYNSFTGQLKKVVHQHTSPGISINITNRFVYDAQGRVIQKYEQINSDPEVMLSQLTYNELGQLIDKKLHQKNGGNGFIQSVDYRYNIHGKLTSINDPSLAANSSINSDNGDNSDEDKFGMQISYEQAVIPQYNNNIGAIAWKVIAPPGSGVLAPTYNYDFRYDKFDRFTEAVSSLNGIKSKYFDEYVNYDDRGNIQSLGRWAKLSAGRIQIDSLNYQYSGDQIKSINDQSGNNTYGFSELVGGLSVQQSTEYQYDANGNVIQDLNKGISQIIYNNFNLPVTVTWADGRTITYDYDGDGNKLKKDFNTGSTTRTTDYTDGIQYEQGLLSFISTSEGIIRKDASTNNYYYQYALTDNLGNTRVMLQPHADNEAIADIVQVSGYYPFGLEMQSDDPVNLVSSVNGDKNNYLYTGKEIQEGINEYDFGARLYDASTGRWNSPDPANQLLDQSPYLAMGNNPVINTDPDGRFFLVDDLIAAGIGGLFNLASNALQGNLHGIGSAFSYFAVGALSGEATLYGGPIAGGAVLGAGNNLTSQVVANGWGHINFGQLATSTIMSVATSYIGGQIGSFTSPYTSTLTSGITSPILNGAATGALNNTVSGFALGAGFSLAGGNNLNDALDEGLNGAAAGFAMGAITGGVEGYKTALQRGLNPWSGKSTLPELEPARPYSGVVYEGFDKISGEVKYVGITERDPQVRFDEHKNAIGTGRENLEYRVKPGAVYLNRLDLRIEEQNLINHYELPNLLNKRNSIAPKYWYKYNIKR